MAIEQIIINVVLNSVEKGDHFVYLTANGDYLLGKNDLSDIGFKEPAGKISEISGKEFLSLRSMEGVSFSFNERKISLEIMAEPGLLREKVVDLKPARRTDVYYPKDMSVFLNYGLNYYGNPWPDYRYFSGTTQLGARAGDFLLLNDSTYTSDENGRRFVRLMTDVIHESRLNMNRIVIGDTYAASGYLGSTINMGGLSFSRNFKIDPYFIKQPVVDYTGFATLPSEVKVSIDGSQVRSEKVSPGRFDLKNILAFSGVHDLNITIKDAFGREETLSYPFYSSDILLRKGIHEFSYNAGFIRDEYGIKSNSYGRFACSFFHHYGFTDAFTAGVRGEGERDFISGGPQMSFLLGNYGITRISASASAGKNSRNGYAGSLGYTYRKNNISLRFLLNSYTKRYSTLAASISERGTRYELGAGAGYSIGRLGSISLDFGMIKKYAGNDREDYTINYSRDILKNLNMYLTASHSREDASDTRFTLGLTYSLWKETLLTLRANANRDGDSQTLQIQKSAPSGEGYGYRASISRTNTTEGEIRSINPFAQYNGPYGIYSAEFTGNYTADSGRYESVNLNASGSIACVGGTISPGRPISDSFGLVKVENLKNVAVYLNNNYLGRTNGSGVFLIPSMNSYNDNLVTINDRDIPVEYSLEKISRYISPPFRSGTFLPFNAIKIQAFTGRIEKITGGLATPLEMKDGTIMVNGGKIDFFTGRSGEFYLENIPPGRYRGTLRDGKKSVAFTILIPRSDDPIVNIGGIQVDNDP